VVASGGVSATCSVAAKISRTSRAPTHRCMRHGSCKHGKRDAPGGQQNQSSLLTRLVLQLCNNLNVMQSRVTL
jgi:hypothetical protein